MIWYWGSHDCRYNMSLPRCVVKRKYKTPSPKKSGEIQSLHTFFSYCIYYMQFIFKVTCNSITFTVYPRTISNKFPNLLTNGESSYPISCIQTKRQQVFNCFQEEEEEWVTFGSTCIEYKISLSKLSSKLDRDKALQTKYENKTNHILYWEAKKFYRPQMIHRICIIWMSLT